MPFPVHKQSSTTPGSERSLPALMFYFATFLCSSPGQGSQPCLPVLQVRACSLNTFSKMAWGPPFGCPLRQGRTVCVWRCKQQTQMCFSSGSRGLPTFCGSAWGMGCPGRQTGLSQGLRTPLKCSSVSGCAHRRSFKFRTGRKNQPKQQNKSLDHPIEEALLC